MLILGNSECLYEILNVSTKKINKSKHGKRGKSILTLSKQQALSGLKNAEGFLSPPPHPKFRSGAALMLKLVTIFNNLSRVD